MTVKFRGQRRLVDTDTGEIIETQVFEKGLGDSGFHKVWLHHILEMVDEVGNAKMRVLMWLLTQADSSNQIVATLDDIATATGTSKSTAQRLLKALQEANVISQPRRYGPYRLNPAVIFKGPHQHRMNVLIKYRDEKQEDLFGEKSNLVQFKKVG